MLFLAAMQSELRPLVRLLGARREPSGDDVAYVATRDGWQVLVARIGVGPEMASRSTRRLLRAVTVDRAVVCGIAGAVSPKVGIGTIVVPDVVVNLETGAEHHPTGSDRSTLARLAAAGTVVGGAVGSTAELISDSHRIKALAQRGLIAIDMETASVAAQCEASGCPWAVVRAISDLPSERMVDRDLLTMVDTEGRVNLRAALRFVLSHPCRVPPLARLGHDSARAARRAALTASELTFGARSR